MDNLTNILLWIGMISGGLMILLMMLSIFSGIDMDGDIDIGLDGGHDEGDEGLGILKSGLTFFSMASFTARAIALNSEWSWSAAITSGIIAGIISVIILTQILKLLLRQQESGNYEFWEAEGKMGKVYVPIPKGGIGRITVEINGATREVPAKSTTEESIATNDKVLVVKAMENFLLVTKIDS